MALGGQTCVRGGQAGRGGRCGGGRVGGRGGGEGGASRGGGGSRAVAAAATLRPPLQAAHRVEGRQHAQPDEAVPLRLHQAAARAGGGQGGGQGVVREEGSAGGRGWAGVRLERSGRGRRRRPARAGPGVRPFRQGPLQQVPPPGQSRQALGEEGALQGARTGGGAARGRVGRACAVLLLLVRPGVFVGLGGDGQGGGVILAIVLTVVVPERVQGGPDGRGLASERGKAGSGPGALGGGIRGVRARVASIVASATSVGRAGGQLAFRLLW